MLEILLLPQAAPFLVALLVMLGLGALEVALMVGGSGAATWLDSLLPDLPGPDLPGPDLAPGPAGAAARALSWLGLGRVPALVLLVLLLTGFGIAGILIQSLAIQTLGSPISALLASPPAAAAALLTTRGLSRWLARRLPSAASEAVSIDSLTGRVATITNGTARRGLPAEARLRDGHGTAHLVQVEPLDDPAILPQGAEVLLVRRRPGTRLFLAAALADPVAADPALPRPPTP